MSEEPKADDATLKSATDAALSLYDLAYYEGQKAIMRLIDAILIGRTSDSFAVEMLEKFSHQFWECGTE